MDKFHSFEDYDFDFDTFFIDQNLSPIISNQTQLSNVNSNQLIGPHFDSNSSKNQISSLTSCPNPPQELNNFNHQLMFQAPFSDRVNYHPQFTGQADIFAAHIQNSSQFNNDHQFSSNKMLTSVDPSTLFSNNLPYTNNFSTIFNNQQPTCSFNRVQNHLSMKENNYLTNDQVVNLPNPSTHRPFVTNSNNNNLQFYSFNRIQNHLSMKDDYLTNDQVVYVPNPSTHSQTVTNSVNHNLQFYPPNNIITQGSVPLQLYNNSNNQIGNVVATVQPEVNMAWKNPSTVFNSKMSILEERVQKRMHSDQVVYTCTKCGTEFWNPQAFGGHMKSHSTVKRLKKGTKGIGKRSKTKGLTKKGRANKTSYSSSA